MAQAERQESSANFALNIGCQAVKPFLCFGMGRLNAKCNATGLHDAMVNAIKTGGIFLAWRGIHWPRLFYTLGIV